MSDHQVEVGTTRGLFGGTIFMVRCLCGWSVMGTDRDTADALKRAHLAGGA